MTPNVRDYKALIKWLADTYHRGKFLPISERSGVSSAIVHQWKLGLTKSPKIESVAKICKAYDLDLNQVVAIIAKQSRAAILLLMLAHGATFWWATTDWVAMTEQYTLCQVQAFFLMLVYHILWITVARALSRSIVVKVHGVEYGPAAHAPIGPQHRDGERRVPVHGARRQLSGSQAVAALAPASVWRGHHALTPTAP